MSPSDPYDDKTEIASPSSKRKFLDANTHLKTAIYDEGADDEESGDSSERAETETAAEKILAAGRTATARSTNPDDDATALVSPIAKGVMPKEPVPEHVSRVLEKADKLLAGLHARKGVLPADATDGVDVDDDATIPTEDESDGGSMLDDVTSLERPSPSTLPPLPSPRRVTDETAVAVRQAPIADGSHDVPLSKLALSDSIDESVDEPMTADETALDRPTPRVPSVGDVTTQIEAAVSTLDGAPKDPTMPGHGAPLSDQPIGPGPMAPAGAPQHRPIAADAPTASHEPMGGDLQTLSTDAAPQGMPVPNHMQPRPVLATPLRRSGLGGFVDSIKRLFGWRGPPQVIHVPTEEEEDFSGYGAGTYTVANRHVAQRRKRDNDAQRRKRDNDDR